MELSMSQIASNTLLSTPEAAHFLGVSSVTLRRWRSLGFGPAFIRLGGKPGGAIRYREAALNDRMDHNTITPKSAGAHVRP